MHSPGINEEQELRGQPANPDSPGKMAVKTECVCVRLMEVGVTIGTIRHTRLQSNHHHQRTNTQLFTGGVSE